MVSGRGPTDDGERGSLERLLDARTLSADSFAEARGLASGEPPPGEATFGLDQAVARLAKQLAREDAVGPSAVDILGPSPWRATAVPGSGRVVGEPPGPAAPPEVDRASDPGRQLFQPPLGDSGRQPTPVDTGPVPGDPFGHGASAQPMPAGQSQIGLGGASGPFPNDFYGRDTPPPPTPGPSYGHAGPGSPVGSPSSSASWVPYRGSDADLATGVGPRDARHPDSSSWPTATPSQVPTAPAEHTERTAVERRPAALAPRPSSLRWVGYVLAGVVLGSLAVIVVMRVLLG